MSGGVEHSVLRRVFDEALSLPPEHRTTFLARACGTDDALRREVERLLASDAGHASLFWAASSSVSDETDTLDVTRLRPSGPILAAGARLGSYEIAGVIGAGGMGEVYCARDTAIDRTVAIKVLLANGSASVIARQRFEREARAAAALMHPHICRLLDVGREGELDYLVMELLEGESLAARLLRGCPSLDDARQWAAQIADALAAAHAAGIVHRDLKPANVMLTPRGAVLLDFGIAKRRTRAADGLAELPGTLTRAGVIVGTVQYMAPEQLQGFQVDERADVFAFGAVLYEMVTGLRAFEGSSYAAVIGRVLHAHPPAPSAVVPRVPPALDALVIRCLEKDPAARWSSMADIRTALAAAGDVRCASVWRSRAAARDSRKASRVLVVATIVVLSVIAGGLVLWRRAQPGNSVSGSAVSAPSRLTRVTFDTGLQTDPVFSPAGTDIAYASDQSGNFDIYVRTLESNATRRLTSDPAHEFEPRWSPDGSTIAFRSERDGGGVYVVPAQGGPERRLIAGNGTFQWSPDSRELRYLRPPSQPAEHWTLVAVAATGGAATELFPDLWKQGRFASFGFHPDGRISVWGLHETRGLGFFTRSAEGTLVKSAIPRMPEALNDMVHNGSPRFAWNRAGTALLLETDDNVGIRNLWRVRVDPATLTWLAIERLTAGPGADVAAEASADDSRIVFSAQQVSDRLWRLPFDASGRRLLGGHPITNPNDGGGTFDLTPDGKASLFTLIRRGTYAVDLVRLENESGRLSFVRKDAMSARLSPDGRFAAYLHWRLETTDKDTGAVDATVMIRDMVTGREHPAIPWNRKGPHPCAWTTDGRYLLVDDNDRRVCLWPVSDTMATSSERVLVEHADDARPSPNGRWLLYAMNAGARAGLQGPTIGITTWNGPPDRPAVSVVDVGGRVAYPRWSPDGRRVYYLRQEDGPYYNVWGADVDPATARVLGSPFRLTHYTSRTQQIDPGWSWLDTAVTAKHFYVPVHTESGAIWLLDNIPR